MEQFVLQLLQEQGVPEDVEPEVRAQLVEDLTTRLTDFLNRRLIDALSDEAVEHFNTMLDDPATTNEQLQNFVGTNLPNKDQVTTTALQEFRALYLGEKA